VLAGAAVTLSGSRSIVVDDVCSTGARLQGRGLPADGEQLLVKVGATDTMASVAWSGREECGITFDPPLDATGVQRLRDEGSLGGPPKIF
jgi:hypothetical protein